MTMWMYIAVLAVPGCKGCKEQTARYGIRFQIKPEPAAQAAQPSEERFHGLDLATAPRTTRARDLPDLFEERPEGSASFAMRKGVDCVYLGFDGAVYHIPEKNSFYIQHDALGSSTMTYFGPFKGDPTRILTLDAKLDAKEGA